MHAHLGHFRGSTRTSQQQMRRRTGPVVLWLYFDCTLDTHRTVCIPTWTGRAGAGQLAAQRSAVSVTRADTRLITSSCRNDGSYPWLSRPSSGEVNHLSYCILHIKSQLPSPTPILLFFIVPQPTSLFRSPALYINAKGAFSHIMFNWAKQQ